MLSSMKTLTPEEQQQVATKVLAINIERVAAKQILSDIVAQGLTDELRERARDFLERHPD
jgi:ribosomal protein S3